MQRLNIGLQHEGVRFFEMIYFGYVKRIEYCFKQKQNNLMLHVSHWFELNCQKQNTPNKSIRKRQGWTQGGIEVMNSHPQIAFIFFIEILDFQKTSNRHQNAF